jgi:4-amino-4-deoxy-L-arabinose transferase-like glycosyltransferase
MKIILALVFIIIIGFTVWFRIRTLPLALERDEGEYAYAGQLMLQGVPPYSLAYNMKMPGIYAAYAVILAVFGQTQSGIHLAVLFINLATVVLIFFLAKRFFGSLGGVSAAVLFAAASVSGKIVATANAENFVLLPAIAGVLLLFKFQDSKKYLYLIIAGILLGIAFLMKQHALGFILFGLFLLFWQSIRQKPFNYKHPAVILFLYSFSVLMPFILTCLILWYVGVFENFWFWTFDYASKYVSIVPFSLGFETFSFSFSRIYSSISFIFILSLFGFLSLLWNKVIRKHSITLIAFLVCSFLAICPGLYFREHYFLLLMPAIAILAAAGISEIQRLLQKLTNVNISTFVSIFILLLASLNSFYVQRNYFFEKDLANISRMMFGVNCFPEMAEISKYIKAHSDPNDKIAILGSEPEIFFYTHLRSATSYIYMYPLMETQPYAVKMQQQAITEIENSNARYLIFVNIFTSWLKQSESNDLIFKWLSQYANAHYQQIGLVEYYSPDKIEYHWDQAVSPTNGIPNIMIFERKD